jgi:signal transduction histidine kinase
MTDRIRLLVDHDRNRDLLAEWLADRYEVHAGAGAGAIEETDLCVLDEAGFERNRERVTDWKDRADPVFAPVLLVAEDSYDDLDPETWESVDGLYVVDDIVVAPVEQGLLHRRLENLLSRRELSTDLADSYRRSEERFASLFHAMPDPALVLSQGHVTYVNDAFCTQYGVDRDDTNWRHLAELAPLPPETVETIEAQVERAMGRVDPADTSSVTDAVGEDADPVGTWANERGDAGAGPEDDATTPDVSSGKQNGAGAGAGTASAAWTADPADESPAEETAAEETAAVDTTASGTADTDAAAETGSAASASGWGDDTETVVVETASGDERYVETNVRPLTVDDRRSAALVMRDVTERRERKRRLERQNERLEEFASIVSHDLRNPLQVLGGRLQAIDAEREGDKEVNLDEHVPSMERSVDRMQTLIDDLLTLSRQGETVDDPTTVSLATVAGQAWETTDAPEADLHVRTGRTIAGEDSRVRQLFENLFRNAVEHGGEGVTIVVDDLADGAGFFVADDGPGIPEDEREAVLEMGYTNSDDGTGIGLGIVTEVATAHGWDVALAESADGGVRFEFHADDA